MTRTQIQELHRPSTVERVVFVTTARNEARFVDALVDGVLGQARPPDRWIIVDDGSTDGTFEALSHRVGDLETVILLQRTDPREPSRDHLATAAVPRALKWALAHVELDDYTHIGKIDADVALPPDFLHRLLVAFAADPHLGMTGGVLCEYRRGRWRRVTQPATHVPPPARLYTRGCFAASGGFREQLGWDTIDEVYARMYGFRTRVNYDVVVRHMRVQGSADGTLRGRARHGRCAWIAHYPTWFIFIRSAKLAFRFPACISGLAFLYGYLAGMARSVAQVDDPRFRRFIRMELRDRLRGL